MSNQSIIAKSVSGSPPTVSDFSREAAHHDPCAWKATDQHWDQLKQSRFERGCKLAALSLGFAPIPNLKAHLPDDTSRNILLHRRRLINVGARYVGGENVLRYQRIYCPADSPIERTYDVVAFVNFLQSVPQVQSFSNSIAYQMQNIAFRFVALHSDNKLPKVLQRKN